MSKKTNGSDSSSLNANDFKGKKDKVEFCLNCDDMEELALNPPPIESVKARFHNCKESGKFQGDVCSRLYVLDPSTDPGPMFDED